MLSSKFFQFGNLSGQLYDFETTGDVLPMHTHDEATAHISVIAKGRFEVRGEGWMYTAEQGAVLDFEVGQPHEFVALTDNARVVNVRKN